jgi:cytidyltransferase-like protein
MSSDASARSPWTGLSQFLPTTQKILQFSNKEGPKATDKIVYVAGAFDLFHVGHLDFLEKAKALGTYLIVGLHTDPVVNRSAYCRIIDSQKRCSGAGFVCFCASRIRIRRHCYGSGSFHQQAKKNSINYRYDFFCFVISMACYLLRLMLMYGTYSK